MHWATLPQSRGKGTNASRSRPKLFGKYYFPLAVEPVAPRRMMTMTGMTNIALNAEAAFGGSCNNALSSARNFPRISNCAGGLPARSHPLRMREACPHCRLWCIQAAIAFDFGPCHQLSLDTPTTAAKNPPHTLTHAPAPLQAANPGRR